MERRETEHGEHVHQGRTRSHLSATQSHGPRQRVKGRDVRDVTGVIGRQDRKRIACVTLVLVLLLVLGLVGFEGPWLHVPLDDNSKRGPADHVSRRIIEQQRARATYDVEALYTSKRRNSPRCHASLIIGHRRSTRLNLTTYNPSAPGGGDRTNLTQSRTRVVTVCDGMFPSKRENVGGVAYVSVLGFGTWERP
ncbi:hypothetical protein OG21DRAFT_576655 [Imleria badia]|nr:hypothetical protein OG21DRAFT_576655 [Imleria badia]